MAEELTLSVATDEGTWALSGAWELRAGSHDTTEWLDGAADVSYPGGGPGTFNASNSDGANGYDPAPKMALLTVTAGSSGAIVTLAGGISSILSSTVTSTEIAPAALSVTTSSLTVTVNGLAATKTAQVMVLYN